MRWYQKRKNLNVILSDESDLKDPPRLDDDVVDRSCRQVLHVPLLTKEPKLPARTIRIHEIDVLIPADSK